MGSQNNISDLSSPPNRDASLFLLPIRSEKVLFTTQLSNGVAATNITAAEPGLWEYILIRIPGRGVTTTGVTSTATAAYYQFLINPASVQINRQTLDAQSLSKAGWQFGLWGEDLINITLEGKTPGKYFELGLTDVSTPYTLSYRNLEALEVIVENNGYWFEGEQTFNGPLQSRSSHRQIKMHSDVELMVGEFIWNGMFESLSISEDAEQPYLASFNLVFTAWNERYREETPYTDPIGGAVERGHVPGASLTYTNPTAALAALPSYVAPTVVGPAAAPIAAAAAVPAPPPNVSTTSAAVSSAAEVVMLPKPNLPVVDSASVSYVTNPSGSTMWSNVNLYSGGSGGVVVPTADGWKANNP